MEITAVMGLRCVFVRRPGIFNLFKTERRKSINNDDYYYDDDYYFYSYSRFVEITTMHGL